MLAFQGWSGSRDDVGHPMPVRAIQCLFTEYIRVSLVLHVDEEQRSASGWADESKRKPKLTAVQHACVCSVV